MVTEAGGKRTVRILWVSCLVPEVILYYPDLGNEWSAATLKSGVQMDFLRVAMEYVTQTHWNYFIGGSNYNSTDISSTQVTPFSYSAAACNLEEDSGNVFSSFQ